MLFFTMHGRWVERSLATRRYTYGLTEQAVTTILAEYYRDGFGYADYPGQPGYGISVSSPAFVLSKLVGLPDLKLVAYTEKLAGTTIRTSFGVQNQDNLPVNCWADPGRR